MHTRSLLRFAFAMLCPLLAAFRLAGADKVTSQGFYVEPPTLISLGFEWQIDGDDNRNASVAVSWRKKRDQAWHEGLPFLRIGNERLNENAIQYVTPNMLTGSIFDLEPGTEYECRFVLSDPDGVSGKSENLVTVRTRPEPKPAVVGKIYHVYPVDFKGEKQRRSPVCWRHTTPVRRIPTTSILTRRACSPVTSSWCTPGSTRMIG